MGADEFEEILVGKDLTKLFTAAVEQAQYDYGHAGYTGTIAEKGGYVLIGQMPPRLTMNKLHQLRWEFYEWQWDKKGENPVPEKWRDFVRKFNDLYEDKWGPAIVIELTGTQAAEAKARRGRKGTRDKVWVVCGLASS